MCGIVGFTGRQEAAPILLEELTAKGYAFESQTDTEVIVHLMEMYYSGDLRQAVMKAAARLEGSYALGVLCTEHPGKVIAAREASPLILGLGVGENFFASDVAALVSYTRNAIYLDDGEFAELTPETVTVFDGTGKPVRRSLSRITWSIEAAEKGGYEHFMLKEIMEQPRAVKAALAPRLQQNCIKLEGFEFPREELRSIKKIVITACGSAYYAGCAGKYAIETLCHIPVDVELASELRYSGTHMDEGTLLIVLSQSGETADTIAAMKECQSLGAKTLAIVNVVGSTIAKLADHTLYIWAGPEIAVATTKGYTTQLAAKYKGRNSMFFIGRNTDHAVALEGALKMKKISYIHAEAYAAGELKHGTIALIDEGRPVIALCCNGRVAEKTMNNIVEVKARGAKVLALACKGNRGILSQADDVIYIPSVDEIFSAAVEIVPLQLLAYHVAKEKERDIDKPRNLAKCVTVE